jgi:hypothetical protein
MIYYYVNHNSLFVRKYYFCVQQYIYNFKSSYRAKFIK